MSRYSNVSGAIEAETSFWRKAAAFVTTVTVVLLSLNACGGPDVAQWTEEVQLHDGKVITLERRSTLGSAIVLMEHRPLIASWELCYPPMKVYWKSNEPFQPSHFEIANGEAYVKVPVDHCATCAVAGYPEDSTLYFILRDGKWQQISASQYPDKRWKNLMTNMIWNARRKEGDIRGHWSVKEKWERDDIHEGTITGQRVMREQRESCSKNRCEPYLKLEIEAISNNSFCN